MRFFGVAALKKDLAYEFIKNKILQGDFQPNSAIDVKKITETLNISRTPVNKALRQLEDEGYLEIVPQVGVFVKQQDFQEVYEKMLLCAQIDALLTEHAAQKIGDKELYQLKEILNKMENPEITPDKYDELNVNFHRIIVWASGLSYIITHAKKLWDYLTYISNRYELFSGTSRKQSLTEHWMIYFALKEGNSQLAKNLMEKHMKRPIKLLKERFKENEKSLFRRNEIESNIDSS